MTKEPTSKATMRPLVELRRTFHFERYAEIYNDPRSHRFMEFRRRSKPMTPGHLEKWYADNSDVIGYGIYRGEDFVGAIRLQGIDEFHGRADKHTMIDPARTGEGIATEATEKLLGLHPYRIITSATYATNFAMNRVNEKCGFLLQCKRPFFYLFEGKWVDQYLWARYSNAIV